MITDKSLCSGCGACLASCPDQCLRMTSDEEGFSYPVRESGSCRGCKRCLATCPIHRNPKQNKEPQVYACWNEHEVTRCKSTSGGIFSLLADDVLNQEGAVFGATWGSDWNLAHDFIESVDELSKFRGSKYVQSETASCFSKVNAFLAQDRKVLFSGTPCQIAGLQAFLQQDYKSLVCAGIVCHSVPSPKVFRMYRDEMCIHYGQKIQSMEFRKKTPFWRNSQVVIQLEKDRHEESVYDNTYTQGFFSGLYSRPSCHHCRFKLDTTMADITLGDFWGIEHVLPDMDDNRGTSLVLLHTEKGRTAFERILNHMRYQQTNLQAAINFNPYLVRSVAPHPRRRKFFQELDRHGEHMIALIEKYLNHQ